jgi:uncharacterized protein (TIGR03437 family)
MKCGLVVRISISLFSLIPTVSLHAAFQPGDVFVASPQGVFRYSPAGVLLQTIKLGGTNTGMAFDSAGNLYVANYSAAKISKFDNNGALLNSNFGGSFPDFPESIAIDKSNNIYVGMSVNPKLVKLSSSGTKLAEWSPNPEWRGVNWIDLAPDQKTIYYTSYGSTVKRFDVSAGVQLPDFGQTSIYDSTSFALRVLSTGGLVAAHATEVVRLDGGGNIAQTYAPTNYESTLYALALDADGSSVWTGPSGGPTVYRFNLASGALMSSFSDSFTYARVTGLAVFAGVTQPTTGTISVTSNLDNATFLISGPANYTGNGKSWTQSAVAPGTYRITYGDVAGYATPPSESKTVAAGGTIAFAATYSVVGATINVSTNIAGATFSIAGPTNYSGSGTSWSKTNVSAGAYTITYGDVTGYATPAAETKTLLSGGSIAFSGTYAAQGGAIGVTTNLANAAFSLTGAANYSGTGTSWSKANAPAGVYTITYNDIAGYLTPPAETKTLVNAGSIAFSVTYAAAATTGTISVKANVSGATYSISGTAAFSGSGTTWSQSNAAPGSYTIVYGALNGYTAPSTETKVLTAGGALTFNGNYVPLTANSGAIVVNANVAAAAFNLTGAATFNGSGTSWSLATAPAGSYTITYGDLPGYVTPLAETKTLPISGSITFTATYVSTGGSVSVATNLAGASFILMGAASYGGSGTSWSQSTAPAGTYTVTYNSVSGYTTPASETKTLTNGGSITFTGNYTQIATTGGTITVSTNRANASFAISGPSNYNGSGSSWSQAGAPAGTYTITYGDLSGYTTPAGRTITLSSGDTITFSGIYLAISTTGTIVVNSNLDGASFTLSGAANYNGTGKAWTVTDAPPGIYTIAYGDVPGYNKPASTNQTLTAAGTISFTGAYLAQPAKLIVPSQTMSLNAWIDGPSVASKSLAVSCGTGCSMLYAASVQSGSPWLTASGSGYTPGSIKVTASRSGLEQGHYSGSIAITSANATNSPLIVVVHFSVQPMVPLTVSPPTLSFTYEIGKTAPLGQSLYLSARDGQTPAITIRASQSTWLTATPSNAFLPAQIVVGINPSDLQPGIYDDTLLLTPEGGVLGATARVRLTVIEAAQLIFTPAALTFSSVKGGPAPASQRVLVTSKGKPVNVIPKSDAIWLQINGGGAPTPLSFLIEVNPASLDAGVYSSSITFTSPEIPGSSIQLPITLTVASRGPVFTAAAVTNAASGSDQLAPCSIITIFGSNLSKTESKVEKLPMPLALGTTTVRVDGKPIPLFLVRPDQINAQLPCDQSPGIAVLEINNGSDSAKVSIPVVSAGPGVFLNNGTWAAAQNEDLRANAKAAPAKAGSLVTIYFTGQGGLDTPIATGEPAPLEKLVRCRGITSARFGTQVAKIEFIGLTPGSVGLAQANVRIPDLPAGDYPVVLSIGGVESNIARISVAAN